MANEYIFFGAALRDRFLAFLAGFSLVGKVRADTMEGTLVALPDDLPDDIEDAVEAECAALMEVQRDLTDATDGGDSRDLMGIAVRRSVGWPLEVRLPARLARRLFEHFNVGENHELVAAIVHNALDPADGPICRRSPASP